MTKKLWAGGGFCLELQRGHQKKVKIGIRTIGKIGVLDDRKIIIKSVVIIQL